MTTDPGMAELARARQELATWLYKGVKGTRAHERVAELIDAHQTAVKAIEAHQLAEEIRAAADRPRLPTESNMGRSLRRSRYRQAADLIDPRVQA